MNREKYSIISFLPEYQCCQHNLPFVNIQKHNWGPVSFRLYECLWGGGGEVKKIKVISDKNAITRSNFERPRTRRGEHCLEIRYQLKCNWKQESNSEISLYDYCLWEVTPCGLVYLHWPLRGTCCSCVQVIGVSEERKRIYGCRETVLDPGTGNKQE